MEIPGTMMTIPPASIDESTLSGLEWPRLLDCLRQRLATPEGIEALEAAAIQTTVFQTDLEQVRSALAQVGEMVAFRREEGDLALGGVRPAREIIERAEKGGALTPEELRDLLTTHRVMAEVARCIGGNQEFRLLAALGGDFTPLKEWAETLERAFTAEGELSERAYPQLRAPRREIGQRRKAIYKILDGKLRSRTLAKALQEKLHTLRAGRFVLPVKADFRGQVPGIVHDASASGVTLYIEPQEVVEEGNALTMAERRLAAAEQEILAELSAQVAGIVPEWRSNLDWLAEIDLLHARAALAENYGGTLPHVGTEGRINLIGAANPLMLLDGEQPVRNPVVLGEETRCMIISGANTGGKTVLLKTLGLCALMVRFGLPLPALEGSRFDVFPIIRADIGDRQSLSHSLSTFSAQISFMADVLNAAGPGSLILVDEILTGTAPEEGAALAGAALAQLADRGGVCVATTHYGELKALAAEHPAMVNASVTFDLEKLLPTYRLLTGTPGASFAFPIASRYGLADDLVRAAEQKLAERGAGAEALVTKLQEQEQNLARRAEKQERREEKLAQRTERLAQKEETLTERERDAAAQERGEIRRELEAARQKIAAVIRELQNANSLPLAGRVRQQLDQVGEEVLSSPEPPAEPLAPEAARPGQQVTLRSTGSLAVLEEVLDEGRRARVRLGKLPLEVEWSDLAPGPGGAGPSKKAGPKKSAPPGRKEDGPSHRYPPSPKTRPPASGSGATMEPGAEYSEALRLTLQTGENTLDLRGQRLEESWERAEAFFDQCMMKHVSPVVLIHGHGTGKLKSGLRARLTGSPYVAEFRVGGKGEGWDGVTVVALNL